SHRSCHPMRIESISGLGSSAWITYVFERNCTLPFAVVPGSPFRVLPAGPTLQGNEPPTVQVVLPDTKMISRLPTAGTSTSPLPVVIRSLADINSIVSPNPSRYLAVPVEFTV